MNKEIAKIWCDALRSGEYEQGRGCLNPGGANTYCCLGVLCELARKSGVIKSYETNATVPPYAVQTWAGMKHSSGVFSNDVTLICLNDGIGLCTRTHSFSEIADLIEKNVEEL